MPKHQKYSGRVHTKRQLGRVMEHLDVIARVLLEVEDRYKEAVPLISEACTHLCDMTTMMEALVDELKDNL